MAITSRVEGRGTGMGASLIHGRPGSASNAWMFITTGDAAIHRGGGRGRKAHKKKGMHGRRSGSPLPYQALQDPWKHKDMIRSTKSGAARSASK